MADLPGDCHDRKGLILLVVSSPQFPIHRIMKFDEQYWKMDKYMTHFPYKLHKNIPLQIELVHIFIMFFLFWAKDIPFIWFYLGVSNSHILQIILKYNAKRSLKRLSYSQHKQHYPDWNQISLDQVLGKHLCSSNGINIPFGTLFLHARKPSQHNLLMWFTISLPV